jgi:PAS domain S-box-containing protein
VESPPLKILLVEDNVGDARLIREYLREAGAAIDVRHAGRLEEGLALLAAEPFDAVLLDLSLPDSRGMDTVERARAGAAQLPLIILTGLDDADVALRAVREGAQDYLVKGRVDGELLVRSIRYAIERKKTEEEIRYFNEFTKNIIESTQVGLYVVDQEGGVVFWNHGMERDFGVPAAELVGKNIFDAFPVLRDEPLGRALQAALTEGEPFEQSGLRHRTRLKGERVVNTKINALRDGRGGIVGAVVITEDVTERVQSQEALRVSEERYRSLVETIQEGFIVADGDENILIINDAYSDMLGYRPGELVGRNVRELVPPEEVATVREMTRRKRESGESTKYELAMVRKDGERRDLFISSSPLLDRDGNYSLTIGVATDITEQKRTREELELKTAQLAEAHRRADELLRNILPDAVIAELAATSVSQPRLVAAATIVFVDFVSFTRIAAEINHKALLTKLAAYFHAFDLIVKDYGLEKLKTVGDGYMFAGGLFAEGNQLEECVRAALDVVRFVGDRDWHIRVGINAGPCIAGLVKGWRMVYDVWGATVNLASRLEEASEPGRINVSRAVCEELKGRYDFEYRGEMPVRNYGPTPMYFLKGKE